MNKASDEILIRFTKDVNETFVSSHKNENGDFELYGPYKKNDLAFMDSDNAMALCERGYADVYSDSGLANNGGSVVKDIYSETPEVGGIDQEEGGEIGPKNDINITHSFPIPTTPPKTNEYDKLEIPKPKIFNVIELIEDTNYKVYNIQFRNRPQNRSSLLITNKHYQFKEIKTWIKYSPDDISTVMEALYTQNLEHIISNQNTLRQSLLLEKLKPPKKVPRWEFFLEYLKTRQDNKNLEPFSFIEYDPINEKKLQEIIETIDLSKLVRDTITYSKHVDEKLVTLYSAYLLEIPQDIMEDYNNFNPTMISFTNPGVGKSSFISGIDTVRKDAHVSEHASSPGLIGTVTRNGTILQGALDNFFGCLMIEEIDTNYPDIFKHMNSLLEQGLTTISLCGRSFKIRSALDVIITGNIKKHTEIEEIIKDFTDTVIKMNPNIAGFGRRMGVLAIGEYDVVKRTKKPEWWSDETPRYILHHINKYIEPAIRYIYSKAIDFLNKDNTPEYAHFIKQKTADTIDNKLTTFLEAHVYAFYRRNSHGLRIAMIQNLDIMYKLTNLLKDPEVDINKLNELVEFILNKAHEYVTILIDIVCCDSVQFICENFKKSREKDIADWKESEKENSLTRWLLNYFDSLRSGKLNFKIQLNDITTDLKNAVAYEGIDIGKQSSKDDKKSENLYARVKERIQNQKFKLIYGIKYNDITKVVSWGYID